MLERGSPTLNIGSTMLKIVPLVLDEGLSTLDMVSPLLEVAYLSLKFIPPVLEKVIFQTIQFAIHIISGL